MGQSETVLLRINYDTMAKSKGTKQKAQKDPKQWRTKYYTKTNIAKKEVTFGVSEG